MNRAQPSTGIETVHAWHDALNAGDLNRLVTLMHDDVAFGGPRGEGRGAAAVREWAERSGIRLEPERWFERDATIVVAQRARWLDPETGQPGPPQEIASIFTVDDGRIVRIARHGSLQDALDAVGVDADAGGV